MHSLLSIMVVISTGGEGGECRWTENCRWR